LNWKLMVDREEFQLFVEKILKEKKMQEAQRFADKQVHASGLCRGGLCGNRSSQSQPVTLHRGANSRSEPSVPGPRQEMLSPKGGHSGIGFGGEETRPHDRASEEEEREAAPQMHPFTGRSLNNNVGPQVPPPASRKQGGIQSRATVGGNPQATDMRRHQAPQHEVPDRLRPDVGSSTSGRLGQPQLSIRGRDGRMPQPSAPFSSAGGPPPVSGRGAGSRLETTAGPNPNSSRVGAGPSSALDSSMQGAQGAQRRISSMPNACAGGHARTPSTNSHLTPRPQFAGLT